jgi:hypothetical protein
MSGNLSELDQINETDIIEAFNGDESVSNEETAQSSDLEQEKASTEDLTNIPDGLLDEEESEALPEDVSSGEIVDDPGEIEILPLQEIESALEEQEKEEEITLSSSGINDLADILGKLLNNKTIEITIKIKD